MKQRTIHKIHLKSAHLVTKKNKKSVSEIYLELRIQGIL